MSSMTHILLADAVLLRLTEIRLYTRMCTIARFIYFVAHKTGHPFWVAALGPGDPGGRPGRQQLEDAYSALRVLASADSRNLEVSV